MFEIKNNILKAQKIENEERLITLEISAFNGRCHDALVATYTLTEHIHQLHQAVLLATKNVLSPELLNSHTLTDVIENFIEKTNQIPLYKSEPERLLQFVKFSIKPQNK